MHVSTTTRRSGENEYNATLLRRSYREDGKVKKETLANLSHLPPEAIDAIRAVLAGKTVMSVDQAFEIERSLPAGHVTASIRPGTCTSPTMATTWSRRSLLSDSYRSSPGSPAITDCRPRVLRPALTWRARWGWRSIRPETCTSPIKAAT